MKKIKFVIKLAIAAFITFTVCMIGLYTYAYFSPSLDIKSSNNIQIFDSNNELISQGSLNGWTKIEDISPYLINAVISAEDKNFYHHQGFDYLRIAKAFIENIKNKRIVQGASTISQQYIKNLYLNFDKTWKRKAEEALLTLELEVHYNKDEILEGYLNTINYGQGNFGITSASRYYFGKEPKNLSLEESLMLAGIPKNPTKYNPVNNYDECINRAKIIGSLMLNNKMLTKDEYASLFKSVPSITKNKDSISDITLYYTDGLLDELKSIKEIPDSLIHSKGLKIYTYFDPVAEEYMEQAINNNLQNTQLQVASIMLDPNSGGIIALAGGKNYSNSQFNRATKAKRQVGSTMKPFLYYAALENDFVSSTTFSSEKTVFNLSNNKKYSPSNYNDLYANKDITMAAAIALSDNIYAIKTNLFLGVDKMIEVAKRCGIEESLDSVVSLALGTKELIMKDYANGYLTLASGGYKRKAHLIKKVEDKDGNLLYEYKSKNELVLNPNYTYILNEMLTNTYNKAFSDYVVPSALTISAKITNKYAIKTGTTNTDYWISGYNPDILMLTWIGYDDNKEVSSSDSKYAKNIWVDTVESYLKNHESTWYEKPEYVTGVIRDSITGTDPKNSEKSAIYYYVSGTEQLAFNKEKKDS